MPLLLLMLFMYLLIEAVLRQMLIFQIRTREMETLFAVDYNYMDNSFLPQEKCEDKIQECS